MKREEIRYLERLSYEIRVDLVKLATRATIHIGGDLSAVELLTVLWQSVMEYDVANPKWEERDRFFLSKGHCAATVAFNQAYRGCFNKEEIFDEYATDNARFSMAPCCHVNHYFESSATGSLGQGLPIAVGVATALKVKGNNISRVFVMLGDGELQEGSNWEAIMLASELKLNNLIVIIDNNKLQFDGITDEIVAVNPVAKRFQAFDWKTFEVDGHSIQEIIEAFDYAKEVASPVAINANTIKGKGVDYMEHNPQWHAGRIKEVDLKLTLDCLSRRYLGNGNV